MKPTTQYALVAALVVGLPLLLFLLDRALLFMEARDWVYYRNRKGKSSSIGNALAVINEALDPSVQHIQTIYHQQEEREPGGDPLDDEEDECNPFAIDEESPRRHSEE